MLTLLIDNYDSYTFNLYGLLGRVNGRAPVVVRNDEASWPELERLAPDNIVISPGPGRPGVETDFGVCADAIDQRRIPVLGVCLGHQGIAQRCGGSVVHAPRVAHGQVTPIEHEGRALFAGLPQRFAGVRYHSLMVAPDLPAELRMTAWTDEGLVMGIAHRERPLWGVQFHPESICTEHGFELLSNFAALTRAHAEKRWSRPRPARKLRRAVAVGLAAIDGH